MISIGLAKYPNLFASDYSNVLAADMQLDGINRAPFGAAVLQKYSTIESHSNRPERTFTVNFTLPDTVAHKVFTGHRQNIY